MYTNSQIIRNSQLLASIHEDITSKLLDFLGGEGKNIILPYFKLLNGQDLLQYAAYQGKLNACRILINKQCSLNVVSSVFPSPLFLATMQGHQPVAEFLLSCGANLQIAIIESEYFNDSHMKQALENLKHRPIDGHLFWAIKFNQPHLLQILLEKNPPKDQESLWPLLCFAAWRKVTACVELLLNAGVKPDSENNRFPKTPLYWAVSHGNSEMIQCLIKHKANCNLAYAQALQTGSSSITEYLSKRISEDPLTYFNKTAGFTPSYTQAQHAALHGISSALKFLSVSQKDDLFCWSIESKQWIAAQTILSAKISSDVFSHAIKEKNLFLIQYDLIFFEKIYNMCKLYFKYKVSIDSLEEAGWNLKGFLYQAIMSGDFPNDNIFSNSFKKSEIDSNLYQLLILAIEMNNTEFIDRVLNPIISDLPYLKVCSEIIKKLKNCYNHYRKASFQKLHQDFLIRICENLSYEELVSLSGTSKYFHHLFRFNSKFFELAKQSALSHKAKLSQQSLSYKVKLSQQLGLMCDNLKKLNETRNFSYLFLVKTRIMLFFSLVLIICGVFQLCDLNLNRRNFEYENKEALDKAVPWAFLMTLMPLCLIPLTFAFATFTPDFISEIKPKRFEKLFTHLAQGYPELQHFLSLPKNTRLSDIKDDLERFENRTNKEIKELTEIVKNDLIKATQKEMKAFKVIYVSPLRFYFINFLEELHDTILMHVCKNLDYQDLLALTITSKYFYQLFRCHLNFSRLLADKKTEKLNETLQKDTAPVSALSFFPSQSNRRFNQNNNNEAMKINCFLVM